MKKMVLKPQFKICVRCKEVKSSKDFFRKSRSSDGLDWWCKNCCKSYMKGYIEKNKEEIKKATDRRNKIYYQENKEQIKKSSLKYYYENLEECREKRNQYGKEHREDANARSKKYYSNVRNRLCRRISGGIRRSLKLRGFCKNGAKWESLVEFTAEDLLKHFYKRSKLLIEEYGIEKLHIDHIIPIALYVFSSYEDEEFKKCWNIRNLRLSTVRENVSKNKYLNMKLVKKYHIEDLLPRSYMNE